MSCIFCGIINGKVESSQILNTNTVISFLDINPVNPGHVLVLPKRHAETFTQLTLDEASDVITAIHRICGALEKANYIKGHFNLFQTNGIYAGQEIKHCHFHIIPRHEKDSLKIKLKSTTRYSQEQLDDMAEAIRGQI